MKKILLGLVFLFSSYSMFAFASDLDSITWKGTYYHAVPNKTGISQLYCQQHTPGSFLHVVTYALTHPVYTDKGIKLDRATFNSKKTHGIYLITGDFWATGKTNNIEWQDHIYYFLSKLTEAGETRGVWSSEKCKGLYVGVAV